MSKRMQSQCSGGVDLQFDNFRVKWLIYNATSLVAFAENIVASQDHVTQREDETIAKQLKVSKSHLCPIKTESAFGAAAKGRFHIRTRFIFQFHSNRGHVRNGNAVPQFEWKRFSNIQDKLWADRFRLRSLSSRKGLSVGWKSRALQCDRAGSVFWVSVQYKADKHLLSSWAMRKKN